MVTSKQTTRLLDGQRTEAASAREAERAADLQDREDRALANLLPVLSELQGTIGPSYNLRAAGFQTGYTPAAELQARDAYSARVMALRVDVPLITNADFRQRFRVLVGLADQLADG